MSLLNQIKSYFTPSNTKLRSSNRDPFKKVKKNPLSIQINKRIYRIETSLKLWKEAVQAAENPLRPDRLFLYTMYNQIMEDDMLLAQVRTARFNVQMGDFYIARNNEEDEETTKFFDTTWFFQYLEWAVDTELFGHSLIEFSFDKDGNISEIELLDREHVRPETGIIVLETSDSEGIPYREFMNHFNLVEIGSKKDLGLLKPVSKSIIRKDYNITDWGRSNERFGMPFVVARTATRDENELDEKEHMLRNFGSNGFAILDDADQLDFLESKGSSSGNGHMTFKDMNDYLDSSVAILINGQTGTTEEQAYVGSAEVHERTLNKYTLARMRKIQYQINDRLIPFLLQKGLPLDHCEFRFRELDKKEQNLDISESDEVSQTKKKKTKLSLDVLKLFYKPHSCSKEHNDIWKLTNSLFKINTSDTIKQVFKNRSADIQEVYQDTFKKLDKAVTSELGTQFEYRDNRLEVAKNLKRNVATFAAFKSHHFTGKLVAELTDPKTGKLRSWRSFQIEANKIDKLYNQNWLKTEYETAVRSTKMAKRWKQVTQSKDLYPYLRYETQRDARVRPEHASFEGVTKKVDDPFWEKYFPPNGWNCRCDVVPTDEPGREEFLEPSEKEVPTTFRHNNGLHGEIFNESHPFFKDHTDDKYRIIQEMQKLSINDEVSYIPIEKGIKVHFDTTKNSIQSNIEAARELVKNGHEVKLLPEYTYPKKTKWADFLVDNSILTEFKNNSSTRAENFVSRFREGKKQLNNNLITFQEGIVLMKNDQLSDSELQRAITSIFRNLSVVEFWILRNGKIHKIKKPK